MAPLTTMKLPAQNTMTTRTPSSARRRSLWVDAGRLALFAAGRSAPDSPTPAVSAGGSRGAGSGARRGGGPRPVRPPPGRRASRSMRRSGRCRSGAFLVELEQLLVILFGDLQPDEESGEDRERDDDQRGEGDPQRDRDGLQSLHGCTSLRFGGR